MVQGVECFPSELDPLVFGDGEVLAERQIESHRSGSDQDVASGVSVLSRQVRREQSGVEIAGDPLASRKAGVQARIAEQIGPIRIDASQRIVLAGGNRERQSALNGPD